MILIVAPKRLMHHVKLRKRPVYTTLHIIFKNVIIKNVRSNLLFRVFQSLHMHTKMFLVSSLNC